MEAAEEQLLALTRANQVLRIKVGLARPFHAAASGWCHLRWPPGGLADGFGASYLLEEPLLALAWSSLVIPWGAAQLEASRGAGVEALRDASRKLFESYQSRAAGQRRKHQQEMQQLQAYKVQQEEKLQRSSEDIRGLAEGLKERADLIRQLEERLQRMEEEKGSLVQKKRSFEERLQQMVAREEDGERCLDLQKQISTLQEQISHLQKLIQDQHRGLREVIQEAEELKEKLRAQEELIEKLTEKLSTLETENQELKAKVDLWPGLAKEKVSKAAWTQTSGASGAAPSVVFSRLRKLQS